MVKTGGRLGNRDVAGRWLRRLFKIDEFGLMINRCRDICTIEGGILFLFSDGQRIGSSVNPAGRFPEVHMELEGEWARARYDFQLDCFTWGGHEKPQTPSCLTTYTLLCLALPRQETWDLYTYGCLAIAR